MATILWNSEIAKGGRNICSARVSVYVVDQPAGVVVLQRPADGELTLAPVETTEHQFTAIEKYNLWPQARLHTQWPGAGVHGDATFEQFRASQNPSMTDNAKMDAANRAAGAALLRASARRFC